ncbi:MAG: DNA replication/repair protein RecF [Clostridia bacterium]|nr:DNA replication/repair protein RecF [Clostridia bacterium]
MFVKRLALTNFRNYSTLDAQFGPGVNIFYGDNGQGKTNIIESIFYCAIGRSFRYSKDNDLIRTGADHFRIAAELGDDITENIAVLFKETGEKAARVNGLYLRKLGHLMGSLLSVIFSPEDLDIVNEGPSVRRKMLDIVISQLHPSHYFDLQQYNKTLAQKNFLLRDYGRNGNSGASADALLDVYNEQLAAFGASIAEKRARFCAELEQLAAEKNGQISGGETLTLKYVPNFRVGTPEPAAEEPENAPQAEDIDPAAVQNAIKTEFLELLTARKSREIERQHSLYGPQNDDVQIELNGMELRRFGSQGQKRTAVLSIKLAQILLLYRKTGRKPVLLLDDVFSELDEKRSGLLLSSIEGYQTFITTASLGELPGHVKRDAKIFFVKSGEIQLI